MAVSYTHLDVYKRQIHFCVAKRVDRLLQTFTDSYSIKAKFKKKILQNIKHYQRLQKREQNLSQFLVIVYFIYSVV